MTDIELKPIEKTFDNLYTILKEQYNFVFKPEKFTRENVYRWVEKVDNTYGNVCYGDYDNDYDFEISTETRLIHISCGATKCVIEGNGWVYKMPFTDGCYNYCEKEVEIYEKAIEASVEEFFAPCYFLKKIDNFEVYIMKYAEVDYDSLMEDLYARLSGEGMSENEAENTAQWADENAEFVEYLFPYYAEDNDTFENLLCFLSEEDINDLHSGNMGYINGNVVLIDYSGFRG